MFVYLFLAFTLIPVAELYLLIVIGSRIGALPTIMIVLLTGIWGAALARSQGFRVLGDIQKSVSAGHMPTTELIHAAMVLVGGVLLLTPGFLTDAFGLGLLLPVSRHGFLRLLKAYFGRRIQTGAISVEFRELD